MNKGTELNLFSDWEGIVNDVDRHNARIRIDAKIAQRRRNRMIGKSVNFAIGAAACMAFGAADLLADWLAVLATVALLCSSSVIAGRVWEASRK